MHPFMKQVNVTHRCAMQYRERALADLGLGGCQVPYLMALYRQPGMTQEELARVLHVNKSTVARQLISLEAAELVRREPSPEDRRATLVFPTEKALSAQSRIRQTLRDWAQWLLQDFSPEEQETLSRLMVRVAARAESYIEGGDGPCGSSADT